MNTAIVSLLFLSYLVSVWNWFFGLWLASLVIIFFTHIFNFYKLKKLEFDLSQILIIILVFIIVSFSSYIHNTTFNNNFATGKIIDNLWNNHYAIVDIYNKKKAYLTTKTHLNIWDVIKIDKPYRQHWQSCQQCLQSIDIKFWLPISSFEKYLFVNWYNWSIFENKPQIIWNEKNLLELVREKISKWIENLYNNDFILKWLILWDKSSLDDEQKQTFKNAGLLHLMVASWWNIALLSTLVWVVFFFLPFYPRLILWLIISILYGLMIWFDLPIARAIIMSIFSTIAILSWRNSFALQWLWVAFLTFWFINPYSIRYDLSFQLSFLAVLGIIVFNWFNFGKNKFWKNILSMILTPIWAGIFTFWIIINLWNYNIFSILTNVLASLLVPILSYLWIVGLIFNKLKFAVDFFSNLLINLANVSNEKWIFIILQTSHYIEFFILWVIIISSFYILSIWNKKSVIWS